MKLIDQFPIYELGGALKHLSDICTIDVKDGFQQIFALWEAKKHLEGILSGHQPISYCRASAEELVQEIAKCQKILRDTAAVDDVIPPIEPWRLNGVKKRIDIFEHQLSAELKKTASYSVPERGIFNIEMLAESADRHIHESIRVHISDFARSEFQAAGRCLAFGMYSASGFHSARAVEDVLKKYYEKFLGQPPDKPMGLLASHLEDRVKSAQIPKPRENTVRHIRDLANFDRNPLMHRNVVLLEIDATTLFNNALGVIVEMVKEMADPEEDKQPPLPLLEKVEIHPTPLVSGTALRSKQAKRN